MHSLFLLTGVILGFATIGYPMLMFVRASLYARRIKKSFAYQPTVSIVLPCYNEVNRIEEKLRNLLELRYDHSKMELVIISDGSTDGTAELIEQFSSPVPLKFIKLTERQGKPNALNLGVAAATGDIIVFSDTRQLFNKNALRKLISNLADPQVGAVSGTLIDYSKAESYNANVPVPESKKFFALFRDYENMLKDKESRVHSVVGVYGSMYALRRKLFQPLPLNLVLDDMLVPFQVILQGFRVVFEKGAVAYEKSKADPAVEVMRRKRIFMGVFQFVFQYPQLLNPARNPVVLQYIGHKVLRTLFPLLFLMLFVTNTYMLHRGFYLAFFVLQCLFYVLCLFSLIRNRKNIFYLFSKYNLAMLRGFWDYLTNKSGVKWQKH